jgi:hypothetical protein
MLRSRRYSSSSWLRRGALHLREATTGGCTPAEYRNAPPWRPRDAARTGAWSTPPRPARLRHWPQLLNMTLRARLMPSVRRRSVRIQLRLSRRALADVTCNCRFNLKSDRPAGIGYGAHVVASAVSLRQPSKKRALGSSAGPPDNVTRQGDVSVDSETRDRLRTAEGQQPAGSGFRASVRVFNRPAMRGAPIEAAGTLRSAGPGSADRQ